MMIEQVAPVFIFVALGYLFKKIKHDISEALTEFVIYFSLPALALSKIRHMTFSHEVFLIIVIAYITMALSLFLGYVAGRYLKLDKQNLVTIMVIVGFGNTGFVGFSYIESFYSLHAVSYALVYDQIGTFIALMTFGVALIAWGGGREQRVRDVAKQMVFSPPLLAIVVAVYFQGTEFPVLIETILDKFQATLIPLVTGIVGMKLEFRTLSLYFKENMVALSLKMVVAPFIMLIGLYFFADLKAEWVKVTLLETAMPPMTMAVVFGIRGGLNRELLINALALGILFSFVSIGLWNFIISQVI
ncbi:AEC family transporter [Sulfurospirillum sp. UCH001]|uniref:AEC family transporter n=1 Tax=Sulfurospirillum sp. UCH001 TaxID=1581011 RepID=UPI00083667D8|nr:AEC family transporter [Sulfurospirillum sp. UCH001]